MYLVALLKSLGEEKCIVFTRFVESTHHLCKLLNFFGDLKIGIKEFSGLKHQQVRRYILIHSKQIVNVLNFVLNALSCRLDIMQNLF